MTRNEVAFTVNGTPIGPPVKPEGDLTPCQLGFLSLRLHAEFKSLKIWSLKGGHDDILSAPPKVTAADGAIT